MSVKKASALTPDEEIERDYKIYKDRFEQWKEQNRSAVGTDAYIKYVQQFEAWEKDVEKRRAVAKKKVENDKSATENDDAAAKAYAQQQEQYMRMHQKGMAEDAIRSRFSTGHFKAAAHNSPLAATVNVKPMESEVSSLMSAMQTVIQSAIKSDIRSPADALKPVQAQSATISAPPVMKSQQQLPIPVVQQPPVVKPVQLWWTRQAEYGPHDRLFHSFGPRAAPATTKQVISDSYNYYVPGWLVQKEMAQNLLVFPNSTHRSTLEAHPSKVDPPKQLPSLMSLEVPFPQDFTIPPPNFRPPLPPQNNSSIPPAQPAPQLHVPMFNPNVPPPSINLSMPPPQFLPAGMKRTHSFPGRQLEPMHIPPQRG
uniref:Uncharacterized protein n=1 Tax=Panagrolaimus superbus TaxID=310955 RepID=A0A914ZAT3_9BILA